LRFESLKRFDSCPIVAKTSFEPDLMSAHCTLRTEPYPAEGHEGDGVAVRNSQWDRSIKGAWPFSILALFLIPSLYWIAIDRSVWLWDQAYYGEVSVNLWFSLSHQPAQWPAALANAVGFKPPGIAWLGQLFVPIGRFAGSIEFGLMLSVVAVQFTTLVMTYKIGKEFTPDRQSLPLLGGLFVASSPLFVGMTHQYLTEPLQLLAVTYAYWIAMKVSEMHLLQGVGHLLCATAIGMAAKTSTPLYSLLPGLVAAVQIFQRVAKNRRDTALIRAGGWKVCLLGVAAFTLVALWYARNFRAVRWHIQNAVTAEFAINYGRIDSFANKFGYWLSVAQKSFLIHEAALALATAVVVGMFISAVGTGRSRRLFPWSRLDTVATCALVHVIVVLSVFSTNIVEEQRYIFPLLASFLILFLRMASWVGKPLVEAIILVALLGQWGYAHARALGATERNPRISNWVKPVQVVKIRQDEIQRVITSTCTPNWEGRYNVVGVELPWMNANALSFYAAKERLQSHIDCHYTSLGYAEKDLSRAWDRLNDLRIAHLISLEEGAHPNPPDFLNHISVPILSEIRHDARFVQLPFDSQLRIVVFRNREEVPRATR
jgi:hypothetical protein